MSHVNPPEDAAGSPSGRGLRDGMSEQGVVTIIEDVGRRCHAGTGDERCPAHLVPQLWKLRWRSEQLLQECRMRGIFRHSVGTSAAHEDRCGRDEVYCIFIVWSRTVADAVPMPMTVLICFSSDYRGSLWKVPVYFKRICRAESCFQLWSDRPMADAIAYLELAEDLNEEFMPLLSPTSKELDVAQHCRDIKTFLEVQMGCDTLAESCLGHRMLRVPDHRRRSGTERVVTVRASRTEDRLYLL
ncbi:hypothetical protein AK812_SmicGene8907 [Symbiodinium microadriaticum]|uniref:Uncharacterized protein n=1 Tax=Symbiodinium microadriaticum TaxID=2951 RepID=A0A1Q9EJT3_SYMMI|nr:hypothetical protein AK812_SmicGene8907 [Symbiodinium microadriaticum]